MKEFTYQGYGGISQPIVLSNPSAAHDASVKIMLQRNGSYVQETGSCACLLLEQFSQAKRIEFYGSEELGFLLKRGRMSNQKKRNFQIEAFKHRVVMDPKYADKTWKILEDAIHEIYNHNASGLSFEELYRSNIGNNKGCWRCSSFTSVIIRLHLKLHQILGEERGKIQLMCTSFYFQMSSF